MTTPRKHQGASLTGVVATAGLLTAMVLVLTWFAANSLVQAVDSSVTWERWADLGNALGVVNSVFSGLAFVALVVTLWTQLRELGLQRRELAMQRQATERSSGELRRSAEAELRSLHVELLRLSLEDPVLADVWPDASAGDPVRRKQLLYANLIYQHLMLAMGLAEATDDQVRATMRHVLGSPIMREYWTSAAALRRQTDLPGSDAWRIGQIGDEVMIESAGTKPVVC